MELKHIRSKIKISLAEYFYRSRFKRQARLYCIGTAKSGTHSIASMFTDSLRSGHEPDNGLNIQKILRLKDKEGSDSSMSNYLRKRDRKLCLDVDSSQLNFYLLKYLIPEFSDARFLLTIRDCYSWLDSLMNDSLRRTANDVWISFREYRFRADLFSHSQEEQILKDRGLYTLDGYLSYWSMHNSIVLKSVPKSKLMVVRTDEITQKATEIAEFCGLPTTSIEFQKTHSFKNPRKFNILREINQNYLEDKVSEHCGNLMRTVFPEIKSIDDSGI